MTNKNYPETIIQQSEDRFRLMKEKMLEPIKQVQQARQQSLKNLLREIEKKQNALLKKKVSLAKLCQE